MVGVFLAARMSFINAPRIIAKCRRTCYISTNQRVRPERSDEERMWPETSPMQFARARENRLKTSRTQERSKRIVCSSERDLNRRQLVSTVPR